MTRTSRPGRRPARLSLDVAVRDALAMRRGSRKQALELYDRSEELAREITAPSDAISGVVANLLQELGDYDEAADVAITEEAKRILMFTFLRGYAWRLASDVAVDVPMPDGDASDPGACLLGLMDLGHDDAWFFRHAFPQGDNVWFRLAVPFHSLTVAMLHEDDHDAPIWPMEVIDDLLRTGYLGGHVDQWFHLEPAGLRRTAPPRSPTPRPTGS
jgi:hypothetical protein